MDDLVDESSAGQSQFELYLVQVRDLEIVVEGVSESE